MDDLKTRLRKITDDIARAHTNRQLAELPRVRPLPVDIVRFTHLLVEVDEEGIPSSIVAGGSRATMSWLHNVISSRRVGRFEVLQLERGHYEQI